MEPCSSAVLQFSVEEIGQLVPLLPNPCTPISSTRWQTEDLDGNKVLFQVAYQRDLILIKVFMYKLSDGPNISFFKVDVVPAAQ